MVKSNYKKEFLEIHKNKILEQLPEGWKKFDAPTAPNGWSWCNNGKSRFSKEYKNGLIKIN